MRRFLINRREGKDKQTLKSLESLTFQLTCTLGERGFWKRISPSADCTCQIRNCEELADKCPITPRAQWTKTKRDRQY